MHGAFAFITPAQQALAVQTHQHAVSSYFCSSRHACFFCMFAATVARLYSKMRRPDYQHRREAFTT